jgi:peptidoglycan/xylan/chitin deacetylase (PgdA/CDA1 family)
MAQRGIVFLMYHELELPGRQLCQSEPGYVRYVLSQESFRCQMNFLRQKGWRGLSVSETLNNPSANSVAITFDDGCETDLISAAPTLGEHGFHATFYATADFVGRPGYLSAGQLRQLRDLAFEIGCHSMTHAYLNDLDASVLRREIIDARKRLEDLVGVKIEHFSCPGGRYDDRTIDLVREAGYRSLATSRAHANSPSTSAYLLGRVAVLRNTDQITFQRICTGETLWQMRLRESMRAAAKRAMGNSVYDRLRALVLRHP